jgi:dihydroxy-acid dehydratase
LDVEKRILKLHVSDEELDKRKKAWKPLPPASDRGYVSMYINSVEQADKGADLDFLKGGSGGEVTRDSH